MKSAPRDEEEGGGAGGGGGAPPTAPPPQAYGGTYAAAPPQPQQPYAGGGGYQGPPAGYGAPQHHVPGQAAHVGGVYHQPQHGAQVFQHPGNGMVYVQLEEEDDSCARVGCIFSWIPLVGWIAWAANMNRPVGSSARRLGNTACVVATVVFIVNVILILSLRNNDDSDD